MSYTEGPGPGQPGHWRQGTLPPGARAHLRSVGVDIDDVAAVRAFYEARGASGYPLPYWYATWSAANPPPASEDA